MASKVTDLVEDLVKPYAETLSLELVEVEYQKKHNGMNLTIFIDKKGGVSIDDCEGLHRLINAPLDDLNPTDDLPYILNVSSLGLDRPFKTERDFKRNIGKIVEINLYAALEGVKKYEGELVDFVDDKIIIKLPDDSIKEIERQAASKVVQKIIF